MKIILVLALGLLGTLEISHADTYHAVNTIMFQGDSGTAKFYIEITGIAVVAFEASVSGKDFLPISCSRKHGKWEIFFRDYMIDHGDVTAMPVNRTSRSGKYECNVVGYSFVRARVVTHNSGDVRIEPDFSK